MQGMTSDQRRRIVQSQAQQDGHWLHGVVWFENETEADLLAMAHAIGDSPYGPFTFAGVILTPVVGWTTHHSIVEVEGRWWLYYHDALPSGGVDHLRSIKVAELRYEDDGRIRTLHPYGG